MKRLPVEGAGFARRGLAAAADLAPCALVVALPYATGLLSVAVFMPPPDRFWPDHLLELLATQPMSFVHPLVFLIAVTNLYHFTWMVLYAGRSPGMRLARIKVVDAEGDPPGALVAALRVLGHVLSAASLGLGWAWAWISPSRRSWVELLSGTWVIKVPPKTASAPTKSARG